MSPCHLVIVLSVLLLATAHAQTLDVPWAMMRSDRAGTGATKVSPLPPWREFVRVVSPYRFTPVVAANNVIYFGSADHNVYAYHLPQSLPMMAAVVPTGTLTPQDFMTLMQTWGKLWEFQTGADVEAAPALADGALYVASTDHHLYALDAVTGKLGWRVRFGDDGRAAPVVDSGVVYVGADDRVFRALDAATGKTLWATELPGEIRAPAVLSQEAAFVACTDHFVYALNRLNGREIWSADVGDDVTSPLTLAEGKVFVVNLLGRLFALDAATGKPLWTHSYPIMAETAPAVSGGRVFLTRDDGNVVALDAETGDKLWTTAKKIAAPVVSLFGAGGSPSIERPTVPRVRSAGSPVVGGNYVYVNAGIPQLVFVLEAATGRLIEALSSDSPFASPFSSRSVITAVLQDDDSPPRHARARSTAQAHLSLYGDFVLVALQNSISVIAPFPTQTTSPTTPLQPLNAAEDQHVAAVLDLYVGLPQMPAMRRNLPPVKQLRTTDHSPITLDGRRSFDRLGHRLTRWLWIEDLGNESFIRRLFGIGVHQVFLTVVDEEGAESDPASVTFQVLAPRGDQSGFSIRVPTQTGR